MIFGSSENWGFTVKLAVAKYRKQILRLTTLNMNLKKSRIWWHTSSSFSRLSQCDESDINVFPVELLRHFLRLDPQDETSAGSQTLWPDVSNVFISRHLIESLHCCSWTFNLTTIYQPVNTFRSSAFETKSKSTANGSVWVSGVSQ